MTIEQPATISVPELAALLSVSRETIYRQIRENTLGIRTIRVGRRIRVSRMDVEAFVGKVA